MKRHDVASKDVLARLIQSVNAGPNPWGKRRLNRFKIIGGKKFQLHATRGWKAV